MKRIPDKKKKFIPKDHTRNSFMFFKYFFILKNYNILLSMYKKKKKSIQNPQLIQINSFIMISFFSLPAYTKSIKFMLNLEF